MPVTYRVSQADYVIRILVATSHEHVNAYSTRRFVTLHVEYAERGKEYGILFIFRLFCEYIQPESVRMHVIYRINQVEYVIPFLVATSHEHANAYSTRSKGFALTWYRALTWYSSPARSFAAPDVPLLVTGQQGSLSPVCRQLSRAPNACAESPREESTKLGHGTKLGRTLC